MKRRGKRSQSARGQSLSDWSVTRAVIETLEGRVLLSAVVPTLHPLTASPAVRALVSPAPSILPLRASGSVPLTLPASGLDPRALVATVKVLSSGTQVLTQAADTTPPTVTAQTPAAGATIRSASANLDVTFSEQVFGVDATDLVLSGTAVGSASVGAPNNIAGNVWRFPISGLVNGSLSITLAPDPGDVQDAAGNDLTPQPTTWSYAVLATLYVDATRSSGLHDGSSWANAYQYLYTALGAADYGTKVLVASGTYKPTSSTDRYADLHLKNGVEVYGGYAGDLSSSNPDARNITSYATTLSGEIGTAGFSADNSRNVVTIIDTDGSSVLDGFTITAGFAGFGSPITGEVCGAGVSINGSGHPTIRNCTFTRNWAYDDGGALSGGSPALLNCTFIGNSAQSAGGAMSVNSATLTDCIFVGNSASLGGAIYAGWSSALTNCTFAANSASSYGGAIYLSGWPQTVTNCILWGNSAPAGAQIYRSNTANVTVSYSNVQGGFTGTANTSTDPLFVRNPSAGSDGTWGTTDDDYGDLHLLACSPAADAGDNTTASLAGILTDRGGGSRFLDVLTTPDTGIGTAPIVDMGAYEAVPALAASAGGPYVVLTGQTVTLSGHGASTAAGALQYAWEWTGDGQYDDASGPTPVFDSAGRPASTVTVRLRVTDAAMQTVTSTSTIKIVPVLYVDQNVVGGTGNGSSWNNAFTDFQAALTQAVAGQEIHVANGTYRPTNTTTRSIYFQLKSGVALLGGYAGSGASNPDARDITLYPSVLSGDIGTVGDGSDNSYSVVVAQGTDSTTVLDGFTITGGNAQGSWPDGGGLYAFGGEPVIRNCIFSGNSASHRGGGMYNDSSSPTLIACTFIANSATGVTPRGGGMCNLDSSPVLTNCIFSGNSASGTTSASGGGIDNGSYSFPVLTNCIFTGNSATGPGGYGAGMVNQPYSSPVLTNCTFAANSASTRAGGIYNGSSFSTLVNCIVWGNTAPLDAQIYATGGAPTVNYSDIQGGFMGTGNIDADPLFVRTPDPASGDYGDLRLQSTSPCIDIGSNIAVPSGITGDLGGNTRISGAAVDMGAYEFPKIPVTISGSGGSDPFYARLSADGALLEIWNSLTPSGSPSQTYDSHSLESLTLTLGGGDDTLLFDFSNGSLPCSLLLDAGAETVGDTLQIIGASSTDAFTATATQITHGSSILSFSGVENRTFGPGLFTFPDQLTIADGTLLSLNPGGNTTMMLSGGLSFGPLLTGKLDLNDNDLVIQSDSTNKAAVLAQATNWISSGRNNGSWNGTGILSTSAAGATNQATSLGVMINDNGSGGVLYPSFSNSSGLNANTILVKYTWYGDSNLDGQITRTDYMMWNVGIASGGTRTGWLWGDFDYSTGINSVDYDLLTRGTANQNQIL